MNKKIKYSLTIAWLYPDLMNTYADRGNIIVLQKRCEWRDIYTRILKISVNEKADLLKTADLVFMGGAQDTQQEIVNHDLFENKGPVLKEKIENNTPGLYICGAYQFLGNYYDTADGKRLPGLEVFPMHTKNTGKDRLIGNIVIQPTMIKTKLVGFENHGGRTYLDDVSMSFAKVLKGFGNNSEDKTEGIIYKNSIGSYLHGPILSKNPELADWLIQKALEEKYKEEIKLTPLDDSLELEAKNIAVNL